MKQTVKSSLLALTFGLAATTFASTSTDQITKNNQAHLDSMESISRSAGTNTSMNLYTPVGFKGAYIGRALDAQYFENAMFQESYERRTQLDGELNLYVTANPNPFFTLWSTLTFGYDYSTEFANQRSNETVFRSQSQTIENDWVRVHNNRDGQREEVGIFENMMVGADIRTKDFKMLARAGSALWIEMSPLTIYRRENRRQFAWFYEAFEPDLTVRGYHNQKSFYRRSAGRLTWPRKTFGGGHIDFYQLPFGMNGQLLVAEPVNNYPAQKRAATLNRYGDAEGLNSFSNPGLLIAGRLARRATLGDLEVGLNFLTYQVSRDIYRDFGLDDQYSHNSQSWWRRFEVNGLTPELEEPTVLSLDFRGKLSNDFQFMGDIAVSQNNVEQIQRFKKDGKFYHYVLDAQGNLSSQVEAPISTLDTLDNGMIFHTSKYAEWDPNNIYPDADPDGDDNIDNYERLMDSLVLGDPDKNNQVYRDPVLSKRRSYTEDPALSMYAKLTKTGQLPYQVEAVYMERDFNSPWGISQDVVPVKNDLMRLGSGTFSYHPNLAGLNFIVQPEVKGGFLKIMAGVHGQLEAAPNHLRFQHKLIGRDLWKSSNSWSRTDPNVNFDGGRPYNTSAQRGRLGDRGENRSRYFNEQQLGGLIGDDQALWEEFVPWQEEHFIKDTTTGLTSLAAVPESQKFSYVLSFDWGKDFGGQLPIFMNVNSELSMISDGMNPTEDLLSGALLMGEPVIGLAKNFYLIGVIGYEGWYSPYGARNALNNTLPETDLSYLGNNYEIDAKRLDLLYHQFALGLGFDWDFASRSSFHVRYKWAKHIDASANDYNDAYQTRMDKIHAEADDNGFYTQTQVNEIQKYQEAIVSNDWTAGFLFVETKVWF